VLSLLVLLSAGMLAAVIVTQGRRARSRFNLAWRKPKRSRMPRLSYELLASSHPASPPSFDQQPDHVWRWNRDTKQFSISLYLPDSTDRPSPDPTQGGGLLLWRLFDYLQDGERLMRQESLHRQAVTEFYTFGPVWHAPTPILLEVLSYLGTDVPLWFDEIYVRECEAGEQEQG
jgi:hypothetical protein